MSSLLLNQPEPQADKALLSLFKILRRYRWSWIWVFIGLFLLTSCIIVFLPAKYQAKSVILIEQQEIPQDLVRSTITSYADQRIQVISQYVMRSENLLGLIQRYQLYPHLVANAPVEDVLQEITQAISTSLISADVVDPVSGKAMTATIAFEVAFNYPNPEIAQKVANDITSLYLNVHAQQRHKMALETADFFKKESSRLSAELDRLQRQLADFKDQHHSQLPERLVMNVNLKERLQRDIFDIDQQLRTLDSNVIHLRAQLKQLEPQLSMINEEGQAVSINHRLHRLRNQELSLLSLYAENHPDVQRVRQEILWLTESRATDVDINKGGAVGSFYKEEDRQILQQLETHLQQALSRYSDEHPEVQRLQKQISQLEQNERYHRSISALEPDNPAYIQLKAQLTSSIAQRDSLIKQRRVIASEMESYAVDLAISPSIEREYLMLMREVTSTADKYREMRAKTMETQLAANLELDSKGERFSLIEPAMLPEKPVSPNRMALFCLAFSASLLISLVVVNVRDSFDDRIYGQQSVSVITGVAPLAVIPVINQMPSKSYRYFSYVIAVVILLFAVLLCATAIHVFIKPIDVLGFILLRRLGL